MLQIEYRKRNIKEANRKYKLFKLEDCALAVTTIHVIFNYPDQDFQIALKRTLSSNASNTRDTLQGEYRKAENNENEWMP